MKLFKREAPSPEETLASAIGEVELPTFPNVVATALDMLAAQVDLTDVADVLARDPGLSVRLLRLTNSAALGARVPIASVHRAAVMLGRNQLESMIISAGVSRCVPSASIPRDDAAGFWGTAAVRASAAAMVAAKADPAHRCEHFTAALLQDMAQPLLAASNRSYGELWAAHEGHHDAICDVESTRMGWTHVDVAVAMGRRWEFPDEIVSLISLHHDEVGGDNEVGHRVARWVSLLADSPTEEIHELAGGWFGFPSAETAELLDTARSDAAATAELFC